MVGGILIGSLWFRTDAPLHRAHGWVQHSQRAGMNSDNISMAWLVRVALAFGVTQLPVESVRQRQLRLGALPTWGAMLSSYDYEQQQIALAALCHLLDSNAAISAFQQEAGWYETMVQVQT